MGILGHFRGVRIKKGVVHFPHTGAQIPLKGQKPKASLAFHPQPSGPWYNAWLAARMSGIKIIKDTDAADVIFVFDDKTESETGAKLDPALKRKAINHRIDDISKTHVAKIFEEVFGYGVDVDPLTYEGKAVQKSDTNATHDGEVVDCPLSRADVKAGSVYQKLIDSRHDGPRSEDLRMAYVSGEIPVVFHKYKLIEKRFGTDYDHVAMGLDFGAVDVMRDKHDGRIYVVDVNKTCMPVLCLSQKSQRRAFRLISGAMVRLVDRVKS